MRKYKENRTRKDARVIFICFSSLNYMISEDDYIKRLGVYIRQLREKKELSQQNLADICNIPKTTIGRIERAEINTTIKTFVKIPNGLELDPKELLNFPVKQ